MGHLQNNIKGQITRSLSKESNQATDNVSSRQTVPAEQSQQSSPDTPSTASDCASEATIQGWTRQHSRSISLLVVKAVDQADEVYLESLNAQKRAVSVVSDAARHAARLDATPDFDARSFGPARPIRAASRGANGAGDRPAHVSLSIKSPIFKQSPLVFNRR